MRGGTPSSTSAPTGRPSHTNAQYNHIIHTSHGQIERGEEHVGAEGVGLLRDAQVSHVFGDNRPASREGDGERDGDGERGKGGSGSGNVGGFSELCVIDTASFEQTMLFWQSVAVDRAGHSGDRRSAEDVCHAKCDECECASTLCASI